VPYAQVVRQAVCDPDIAQVNTAWATTHRAQASGGHRVDGTLARRPAIREALEPAPAPGSRGSPPGGAGAGRPHVEVSGDALRIELTAARAVARACASRRPHARERPSHAAPRVSPPVRARRARFRRPSDDLGFVRSRGTHTPRSVAEANASRTITVIRAIARGKPPVTRPPSKRRACRRGSAGRGGAFDTEHLFCHHRTRVRLVAHRAHRPPGTGAAARRSSPARRGQRAGGSTA
jgi:hypothetical protein